MKYRQQTSSSNQKAGAQSRGRLGRLALFVAASGAVAKLVMGRNTTARAPRREPDAATTKLFADIHRNRTQFSAGDLNKAFAEAKAVKAAKVG